MMNEVISSYKETPYSLINEHLHKKSVDRRFENYYNNTPFSHVTFIKRHEFLTNKHNIINIS